MFGRAWKCPVTGKMYKRDRLGQYVDKNGNTPEVKKDQHEWTKEQEQSNDNVVLDKTTLEEVMSQTTMDKMYLEYSQITKARNSREIRAELLLGRILSEVDLSNHTSIRDSCESLFVQMNRGEAGIPQPPPELPKLPS